MRVEDVAAEFDDPMHHDPERARGKCFNESYRFVTALAAYGIEAEAVSGVTFGDFGGTPCILNGHAAVRVADRVYDWTARQFPPHDQPVPLIQDYAEWRAEWRELTERTPA